MKNRSNNHLNKKNLNMKRSRMREVRNNSKRQRTMRKRGMKTKKKPLKIYENFSLIDVVAAVFRINLF